MKHSYTRLVATFIVAINTMLCSSGLNATTSPTSEGETSLHAFKQYETRNLVTVGLSPIKHPAPASVFSFLSCDLTSIYIEINKQSKFTVTSMFELQENEICRRIPTHIASTFGISIQHTRGWQTSIQYSFLDNGMESTSNVVMNRNFLPVNFNLCYEVDRFSFGLSAENFMNMQWNFAKISAQSRTIDAQTPIGWALYFPELPYAVTASVNVAF